VARQASGHASAAYEEVTGAVPAALRLVVIVSCIAAVVALIYGLRRPRQMGIMLDGMPTSAPSAALPAAQDTPLATSSASPEPSDAAPHVGVVAGHWGSDAGAACPDGLTEVEINLDVAQRVVLILQALGYQADLLEEFDPRLEGFQADALISIHADSCESFPNATPPASGFKVASVEESQVPEAEAQLVACLAQCYAARTGMYFHSNSITYDMVYYHNFYEIDGHTPAAIIETGFMLNDRQMLTERADLVAQGIVDGIVCFIEGSQ
jgi:N-acetylmuramoyl-L-alanine amidase